jgi:hypothetical protein
MDSRDYTNLLDDVLITYLDEQMDENAIFQQNNAANHKSGHTMECFATFFGFKPYSKPLK